jgi:hypothetical protein
MRPSVRWGRREEAGAQRNWEPQQKRNKSLGSESSNQKQRSAHIKAERNKKHDRAATARSHSW